MDYSVIYVFFIYINVSYKLIKFGISCIQMKFGFMYFLIWDFDF